MYHYFGPFSAWLSAHIARLVQTVFRFNPANLLPISSHTKTEQQHQGTHKHGGKLNPR
jgi:uncharacterized paraquat-inducible protein A